MVKGNDIDLENIFMKKWKCEKKRVNKRKTKIIMGVRGIANDIRERQLFEIADCYVDACDFCRDIFNDNYKTSILEKFYRTEKNVMN